METERYHKVNRKSWDAVSDWWQENMYAPERWQLAATNPNAIFKGAERRLLGDVAGRSVCILASGNNLIAIAFASIGAVGCRLLHLEELGTKRESWQMVPVEGLPAEFHLVAEKEQPGRSNST